MKQIFLILIIISYFSTATTAQIRNPRMLKKQKELRELEQLKLIQALNLDEETAVRFVARRNQHLEKIRSLQIEKNNIISEISDKLKEGEKINSKKYRARLAKIEREMLYEKERFYKSLDDILTNDQIARLIVFQSRFRKELMRMMMQRKEAN